MASSALLSLPLVHLSVLLLLATLLGGLIGWQRERHDHPAGLRTHILVCVGAALIAAVDHQLPSSGGRIAAQIVTGVGFLGAGTILRSNEGLAVHGLTTAASVWTVAGIGIAVGYGGIPAETAVVATCIVLFTLTIVTIFENKLLRRRERQNLTLILKPNSDPLTCLQATLHQFKQCGIKVRNFQMDKMSDNNAIRFWVRFPRDVVRDTVDSLLAEDKAILHFDWDE